MKEGWFMKPRRISALLLVICLLCALAACGDAPLAGRYVIADIVGDPDGLTFDDLDVLYKEIGDDITDYAYLDLDEGGGFTLVLFGEVEVLGTYSRQGAVLTLTAEGEAMTAEIAGDRITWEYEDGVRIVFAKVKD